MGTEVALAADSSLSRRSSMASSSMIVVPCPSAPWTQCTAQTKSLSDCRRTMHGYSRAGVDSEAADADMVASSPAIVALFQVHTTTTEPLARRLRVRDCKPSPSSCASLLEQPTVQISWSESESELPPARASCHYQCGVLHSPSCLCNQWHPT